MATTTSKKQRTDRFDPSIEPRWREFWRRQRIFEPGRRPGTPSRYILEMFPYPSVNLHAGLLSLEPVAVPAAVQEGPGLPREVDGQLGPGRSDGVGERAGRQRGPQLAQRGEGREARSGAVVLQNHHLRRAAAERPR